MSLFSQNMNITPTNQTTPLKEFRLAVSKSYTRDTMFMAGIALDKKQPHPHTRVVDEFGHFLRACPSIQILAGEDLPLPDGNTGTHLGITMCLRRAIQHVYKTLNISRYNSFADPQRVIEIMSWGRFRHYEREWRSAYNTRVSLGRQVKKAADKVMHEQASLKKSQKIEALIDNMGLDKWNKKKAEDTAIANARVRDTSLRQEKEYADWLESSHGQSFLLPFTDGSTTSFSTSNSTTTTGTRATTHLRVADRAGLVKVLKDLASNPASGNIRVTCTLDWDKLKPFTYPNTFVIMNTGLSKLTGPGDIVPGHKVQIIGLALFSGKDYAVTKQSATTHRLLPERFHKTFRARNPFTKVSTKMNVMRPLEHSIYRLTLETMSVVNQVTATTTVSIRAGADEPDLTVVFANGALKKAREDSAARITEMEALRSKKIANAKAKGLMIASNRSKTTKTTKTTNTTDDLSVLCDMFKTGMLTPSEFQAAKAKTLSC